MTSIRFRKKELVWHRHPLTVSLVSIGLSALVVVCGGQYLQKRHWEKQAEISAKVLIEQKSYEMRIKTTRNWAVLIFERYQTLFNFYHSITEQRKDLRVLYRGELQDQISEYKGCTVDIDLYFDVATILNNHPEFAEKLNEIPPLYKSVVNIISNNEEILKDNNDLLGEINEKMNNFAKLCEEILLILTEESTTKVYDSNIHSLVNSVPELF